MTIKEYRKTATIKAEKFDGSKSMMDRYGIRKYSTDLENWDYVIVNSDSRFEVYVGYYIATNVSGEHYAIKPETFEKSYQEVGNDIKKGW